MSSTTATRKPRLTQPTSSPGRSTGQPTARRTLTGAGCSVGGRADRPVLRIVAEGERAPVVTRVLPPDSPIELFESRKVRLDDFFVAEYDGDDQRLEIAEPRRSGVRLTRRGRLAVLTASVVAVLGLAFTAASASLANDHPEQTTVVVVTPGQTLWDISAKAAGGGDVRSMMSHLESLNHLDSATLQAGQHLRVPQ